MDLTTLLIAVVAIVVVVWLYRASKRAGSPKQSDAPAGSGTSGSRWAADSGSGSLFDVSYFSQVRDDAVVHVVGEAYRQEMVAKARPPGPDDLPPGVPPPPAGLYKALLVAEPTNQYDRNAIMVLLWSGGAWSQVGYLSREDALRYQPLFVALGRADRESPSPPAVTCDAALIDERGGTGVVLHLGSPGECAVEMATEDRTPFPGHPWSGKVIAFTGTGETTLRGVPVDRHAQVMLARWAGCEVIPRLTKKADALIVANPADLTGNLQKARDYSVPIVDEREFLTGVGIPAEMVGRVAGRWTQG